MIQIDKGIPIPVDGRVRSGGHTRPMAYPLREMGVNDSFFVAAEVPAATQARIQGAIFRVKHATGKQFTTRQVDGGVRVWRVA